jgi:pimeloyl-ACP methyl ester carboxylesterase
LHGLATSGQRTWGDNGWLDLVTEANRSLIVIDIPGHGKAYDNAIDATFEKSLTYIKSKFPDGPIDAVGFSLGARFLLTIASQDPTKFRKLVVAGVGENLFSRDEVRGKRIAEAISGDTKFDDPESQYFSQLADATDINREIVQNLIRSPLLELNTEMLSKIDCPVLVALGDKDFAGPPTKLLNALPNALHVELRGVDHFATPKDFSFIDETLKFLDAEPQW